MTKKLKFPILLISFSTFLSELNALQCDNCILISPDKTCKPFPKSYLETLAQDDVARSAFSSPKRHNLTKICHNSQMTVSFTENGPEVNVEIRVGRKWDSSGVATDIGKCMDIPVAKSANETPMLKDILPNANIHSKNRVCSCNSHDFCNRIHGEEAQTKTSGSVSMTKTSKFLIFIFIFPFLFV